MASEAVEAILSKLEKVKEGREGWNSRCPVAANHRHNDRNPSLTVAEGQDGKVLIQCHKGCGLDEICAATGVEPRDLFPAKDQDSEGRVVIARYDYTDETGKLLYQKERLWPKSFRQRRPDGNGGWEWSLGDTRRVLYRLPKVVEGIRRGRRIWVVAGERDADSLEAIGEVATTNTEGEGPGKWRPTYTETLKGAAVHIVADRDEKGAAHARAVAEVLGGLAASVQVWEAASGKDVTDHLRAGHSLEDLVPFGTHAPTLEVIEGGKQEADDLVLGVRDGDAVIGEAKLPDFQPMLTLEARRPRRERTGVHAEVRILAGSQIVAYSTFNVSRHEDRTRLANLAAENLGDKALGKPIRLRLDEFCAHIWDWWIAGDRSEWSEATDISPVDFLLYPYVMAEAGTIVFGYKGQGKSWLGILWTMMLEHGLRTRWAVPKARRALFVNLERGRASVDRRRAMVGRAVGVQGMRSLHARGRSLHDVADTLRAEVDRHGIEAVVVDSLSRAGTGKLTADDDSNRAMDILNGLGISWVILAHTAKMDGEHVFGSVMHENAADVVVQLVSTPSALDPKALGCRLKVTAANDLPRLDPETYALDFDAEGLTGLRAPESGEFPDLAIAASSSADQIAAILGVEGEMSVPDICEGTGLSRATVYEALKASSRFVRTLKGTGRGHKSVYGLRTLSGLEADETAGQGVD